MTEAHHRHGPHILEEMTALQRSVAERTPSLRQRRRVRKRRVRVRRSLRVVLAAVLVAVALAFALNLAGVASDLRGTVRQHVVDPTQGR
jgi:ferric-dicitrate binding protein FerR (iron transport regulator)